jgi:hypothetical protein
MSSTSDNGRVLRPRASRNNLAMNGETSSSRSTTPSNTAASASTSSSRVAGGSAADGHATSPPKAVAEEAIQTIRTTLKTTAEDVKARLESRNTAVDRLHDPAPSMQAYHRLAIAWLVLTV